MIPIECSGQLVLKDWCGLLKKSCWKTTASVKVWINGVEIFKVNLYLFLYCMLLSILFFWNIIDARVCISDEWVGEAKSCGVPHDTRRSRRLTNWATSLLKKTIGYYFTVTFRGFMSLLLVWLDLSGYQTVLKGSTFLKSA